MALNAKFAWSLLILQLFFIVIFGFFVKYGSDLDASDPKHNKRISDGGAHPKENSITRNYPVFQDVNIMIFLGIGYLYAFLRKYTYTGIGMNFLLCAISVQWGMITFGWWKMKDGKMEIDISSAFEGEFSAASAVIAMGGIFGKVGGLQMTVFTLIETLLYSCVNKSKDYLQVVDVGDAVCLHMFAAIFGCATAYVLDRKARVQGNPNEGSSYNSNTFCILGTLVLWVFWPSFNAAGDEGDSQHRSIMNTFLALLGSGITCFAMSALLNKDNKYIMSHIQNGALAGAVGIGTTSNLMIQPFTALLIGALSGCICVAGFKYFSPFLSKRKIHDPCGINSLHGLSGLFAGITGIIATVIANEETYGFSLYKFYPAMAPLANTTELTEIQKNAPIMIEPGVGRTSQYQALYQFIYIILTMAVACIIGLLTGAILRTKILDPVEDEHMYLDDLMWDVTHIKNGEVKENHRNSVTNQNSAEKQI